MDVNANNCEEAFEWFRRLLKETLFVSLDAEFGGIRHRHQYDDNGVRVKAARSIEERYLRIKEDAGKYPILQIGLCLWTREEKDDLNGPRWKAYPFNINVSPRLDPFLQFERDVGFSTGALEFLIDHGFNLEASLIRGVRYLNKREESQFLKRQSHKANPREQDTDSRATAVDSEAQVFLVDCEARIRQWIAAVASGSTPELYLNITTSNNYHRRCLYRKVESEWSDPDEQSAFPAWLRDSTIAAFRCGLMATAHREIQAIVIRPLQRDLVEAEKREREKSLHARLSKARGLSNWFDCLFAEKLLIVGHNLFQDLAYIFSNITIGDLPPDLAAFKTLSCTLLPEGVIDTKVIALSRVHEDETMQSETTQYKFALRHRVDLHSKTGRGSGTSLGELMQWAEDVYLIDLARQDQAREKERTKIAIKPDEVYEDFRFAKRTACEPVEEPSWNVTEKSIGEIPGWGEEVESCVQMPTDSDVNWSSYEKVHIADTTVMDEEERESDRSADKEFLVSEDEDCAECATQDKGHRTKVVSLPESVVPKYSPIVTDLAFSGYGSMSAQREHEAGYDAFKTGQVFIRMYETIRWARAGIAEDDMQNSVLSELIIGRPGLRKFADGWRNVLSAGGTTQQFVVLEKQAKPAFESQLASQ